MWQFPMSQLDASVSSIIPLPSNIGPRSNR
jgi:hypothetical protein